MNPKVFVSHASEDKDRFVLPFAEKLRNKGIDAWVDKWEMLPGDLLVDKIFEEGLEKAQAAIIIVSQHSITKPWVKEEINAAFVKRIDDSKYRLIPVVLDGVDVPACLKSTVWESIKNLENYEESFSKIVNSIYGNTEKPALGTPPRYISMAIDKYASLNEVDSLIFSVACKLAVETGSVDELRATTLYERVKNYDVDEIAFKESLDILDRKRYIKGMHAFGPSGKSIPIFEITSHGIGLYIRANEPEIDSLMKKVSVCIVNKEGSNYDIAEKLNAPIVYVDYIFHLLKQKRLIDFRRTNDGHIWVGYDISPELKRIATE